MSRARSRQVSRRGAQGGFSLVELLVAAVIGIVVLGVVASLYIANRKVFQFQESYSRLQEAGRYTLDVLGNDLRMLSYAGCGALSEGMNPSNAADPSLHEEIRNIIAKDAGTGLPFWWLDTSRMLWAYDDQGSAPVPPELSGHVADSDILVVKYRSPANEMIVTSHDLVNKRFTTSAAHAYQQGTVLAASDCVHSSAFRMSNANPGSITTIEYASGALTAPDNTSDTLTADAYQAGAFVSPLIANAYYVLASNDPALAETPDPCPSSDSSYVRRVLVVRSLSGSTDGRLLPPRPVVCDVQTLQLRFGVDNDDDLSADQFMSGSEISTNALLWRKVVSVRLDMLVVNPKVNTAEADVVQCLDYNGGGTPAVCPATATTGAGTGYGYRWPGAGKRSAKVFTSTYSLRNRAT